MPNIQGATDYIYVPLHVEVYAELLKRSGKADVSDIICNVIDDFLQRTIDSAGLWSEEYMDGLARDVDEYWQDFWKKFGNPKSGYQWQSIFLPNGSKVKMTYKNETKIAEVKFENLVFEDQKISPSEFASLVAKGTVRNAWRDLWIAAPNRDSVHYLLADDLRRKKRTVTETDYT